MMFHWKGSWYSVSMAWGLLIPIAMQIFVFLLSLLRG